MRVLCDTSAPQCSCYWHEYRARCTPDSKQLFAFECLWDGGITLADFEHAFSLPRQYATPPPRPFDLPSSVAADVSARPLHLSETQRSSWLLATRKVLTLIKAHRQRLHVSIFAD